MQLILLKYFCKMNLAHQALRGVTMSTKQIAEKIRRALDASPRNAWTAELHLQVIKYAEELQTITGKEFCELIGIAPSFGTEFIKMKKIAERLRNAGLVPGKI
jgi:hypothetical protein